MSNPLNKILALIAISSLAACGGLMPSQQQSPYGDVPQVTVTPKDSQLQEEGCSLPEGMVFDRDGGSKQQKHDAPTIAKLRAAGYVPVRTVDGAITWHCGRNPTASPPPVKAVAPVALAAKPASAKPATSHQEHHAAKKAAKKSKKSKETTVEEQKPAGSSCNMNLKEGDSGFCSVNRNDLVVSDKIWRVIEDKLIGDDKKPMTPSDPAPATPEAKTSWLKKLTSW